MLLRQGHIASYVNELSISKGVVNTKYYPEGVSLFVSVTCQKCIDNNGYAIDNYEQCYCELFERV